MRILLRKAFSKPRGPSSLLSTPPTRIKNSRADPARRPKQKPAVVPGNHRRKSNRDQSPDRIGLLSALSRVGASALSGITDAGRLNRDSVTDCARDTDHLGLNDLAWNALGLGDHLGFANLTAGCVRNLAGPDFLSHGAGRVGNLLGDRFAGPRAGRVRNLLGNRFTSPRAGRVRNLLGDRFAGPRAGRVGNLFRDGLLFVTDTGVRNLFHNGFRNLAADGVRLLAMTNFLFHAGAGNRSHFRPRNPSFAADRPAGLFAHSSAATGFVNTAAAASVPFPCSWIAHAFLNDWTRNLFCFCDPFTRAVRNFFGFADGFAHRIADIAVAGLRFGAICRAADFAVFCFADRFADRAADIAVAGLKMGLANGAANVFVTGLEAGLPNRAANVFIAGLETRLPHGAADVFVTSLVDRFVDGVAFVAIAGFLNVPRAGDRNLFRAGVIDRAAAVDRPLLVDGFADGFVPRSAPAFRRAVIATWIACGSRTTLVTGRPAIRGFDFGVRSECQQARDDDPGCVSHLSVP